MDWNDVDPELGRELYTRTGIRPVRFLWLQSDLLLDVDESCSGYPEYKSISRGIHMTTQVINLQSVVEVSQENVRNFFSPVTEVLSLIFVPHASLGQLSSDYRANLPVKDRTDMGTLTVPYV